MIWLVAAAALAAQASGEAAAQPRSTLIHGASGVPLHANAQQPPLPPVRTEASDEAAIDALIGRVYAVISGPAGPRDWNALKALFVPEARLVPVGGKGALVLDIQGYIDRAGPMMAKEGFYESEVARRIERYGSIAHVFSTYESRHAPGEKPFARGINSIQLVFTPNGWRVLHIVWQGETPTLPIPGRYLPAPGRK